MKIDTPAFLRYLSDAVEHYEKTAPTVAAYLDDLYIRIGHNPADVRLVEMLSASALMEDGQWEQPNYAANRFYKLAERIGVSTTGFAGF